MTSPRWMIVAGVLLILGGVSAIVVPLAASLAAAVFVGWIFLLQGALGLYAAFKDDTDRGWQVAFAALGIVLGLSFLLNPVGGALSLTLYVGVLITASGIARVWMGWDGSTGVPRWVLALSGVASTLLGLIMVFGVFGPGAVVLGLLIAFEMLSLGTALVAMGWRGDTPATLADPKEELGQPTSRTRPNRRAKRHAAQA